MNKQEEMKIARKEAAGLFADKCEICLKKYGKNFHFHHIGYRDNEYKHSDFSSQYEYTMYMMPIIEERPVDFALLCNTCHRLVTILHVIKSGPRFERVVDLARRSRI